MAKHFMQSLLILLAAVIANHPICSVAAESSCWRHLQNVTFPESYVIIGDESLRHKFRQIRLLYNEYGELEIPQARVQVNGEWIIFDSADAGSDRESGCYSVRRESSLSSGRPISTAMDIKCKFNYAVVTVVDWEEEGKHIVEASTFVEPTGENVYWRSPKKPGEVYMTSIKRKKSMVIFPDTKLWTTTTPFAVDSRRRLIFWVDFGSTSISYANLLASSGPIATVPTNADTVTFNSMTFDFNLGSIYWLVVVNRNHSVYRYNYTQGATASTEIVASFNVPEDIRISHLNFANSTLSFLAKVGKDYQVRLLPLSANSTSPEVVLQCILDEERGHRPTYIHDFNVFKDKPNWSGPSCKHLNCSDICLEGPKPQCVCPSAATTLIGRESNTCSNITLGLVLGSPDGSQLRIQELPFSATAASSELMHAENVTSRITSDFTIYCYITFNPSSSTSTIICINIGSSGEKLFEKEVPGHNILKFSYQDETDTFRWISEEWNSQGWTSRWCVGNSTSKPKEDFVRHCGPETLENAIIDSSNEAVFWQSGNTIKALFLNDTHIATKEIISTDSPVTILVEEAYQTLILVKPNGNVTMVIYTDPEQFQTRRVHLNDGIKRVNFKYHCQRLYWIESPIEPTDNILFLKSYYFINSKPEKVQEISSVTVDYYLKTDPQTDCGSIEIKPEKVPPPVAGPESSSTPHPFCLGGAKPKCVCPDAATTLTGRDSYKYRDVEIRFVQQSPEERVSPLQNQQDWNQENFATKRTWTSGVMDTRNGAVFWQDANTVKALFLNDSSASAKTILTTDGPVAIELDEVHRTLILISTTGSATIVRYEDPLQFQTRIVHPNDGVKRTNFKYHCQRLYWVEHISRPVNDVLQSFYFINGQTGTVKYVPKGTRDYVIKTGTDVDCGPIEIHATSLEPPADEPAETVFNSTTSAVGLEAGGHSSVTATKSQAAEDMSPLLLYHVQQLCEIYFNTSRTN